MITSLSSYKPLAETHQVGESFNCSVRSPAATHEMTSISVLTPLDTVVHQPDCHVVAKHKVGITSF